MYLVGYVKRTEYTVDDAHSLERPMGIKHNVLPTNGYDMSNLLPPLLLILERHYF